VTETGPAAAAPPDGPVPDAGRAARDHVRAGDTLADGEWHRLHPATPLLRGGIAFLAILGIVIANLRERLVEMFLPQFAGDFRYDGEDYDPLTYSVTHGYVGWILLALAVGLVVIIGLFFLSWRMHSFRVTDEAVEVRSGVLFRTHRKAKLDRVQGVGLSKPFLPRLFGAARLDVNVAGQSADVKLEYLSTKPAEKLRRDVLTLASGARLAEGEAPLPGASPAGVVTASDGVITRHVVERANDFLSPELPADQAPPESIVRIPVGRLIASTIVNEGTLVVLAIVIVGVVMLVNGSPWVIFTLIPAVLGIGSYYWTTITKSLRYSIAGTPSGVRIGFGLLSTSNDTLPPGRVHAVQLSQPLLWRPFGWWQVKINKAGLSAEAAMGGKGNTTVLPVGTLRDATAVVQLMLEGADVDSTFEQVESAIMRPAQSGFVLAPRRARWIDPIAWRRTGYALRASLLVFRTGVLWRKLTILPLARIQSIQISQGPLERVLRLASARVHTVLGPVTPTLPTIAKDEAAVLFERASAAAVRAAASDHSHRWALEVR
jgi:putative membrane protein